MGRVIRAVLASKTMRPCAGPWQPPMATTTSPFLPVDSLRSPTASARSPSGSGQRVDRLGDDLLVVAALGRAAVGLGGDLLEALLLGLELDELLAQRAELVVHRPQLLVLAARGLAQLPDGHALERRERVVLAVARELLLQVLAHLHGQLADDELDLVLDRLARGVAEVALERLGDVPVLLPEGLVDLRVQPLGHLARALDEGAVELPRGALELRLDEVGVRRGLLAVEHPRADLDRVRDEPRGGLAGLLALPGEPDGAGVLHDEPVDEQRLARGADVGGTAEGRGGGGFHGVEVARYGRGLTERRRPPAGHEARRGGPATRAAGAARSTVGAMDELAEALADAGGVGAPREHGGRLRRLLASELRRGAHELGLRRSGYGAPVTVAVAAAQDGAGAPSGLLAVLPLHPSLRADARAGNERELAVAAATVGALVEASDPEAPLAAGSWGDALALRLEGPGDPELATLAFEDQVAGVDRLRARALAFPAHVLGRRGRPAGADRRATRCSSPSTWPVSAAAPPIRARPRSTRRPCWPSWARTARRSARTTTPTPRAAWPGGSSSASTAWGSGAATTPSSPTSRAASPATTARLAEDVGEALLDAGLLAEKPSVGQRHVFLNPRRAGDVRALIERGELPDGLRLP